MTLYEVFYGQKPLPVTSYLPGTSIVQRVDNTIHTRESILHILKENLVMAQNRMKKQENQHHSMFFCSMGSSVSLPSIL